MGLGLHLLNCIVMSLSRQDAPFSTGALYIFSHHYRCQDSSRDLDSKQNITTLLSENDGPSYVFYRPGH